MKIGDKVRFLTETGGGVVAGFQGKNIVLVEDADGFQIPTSINEVVVVGQEDYSMTHVVEKKQKKKREAVSQTGKEQSDKEKEPADLPISFKAKAEERKGGDVLSAYLAFVPIDIHEITKTRFETYLVNDSNYYITFSYLVAEGRSWQLKSSGEIEPNTKLFIEEFGREDLNGMEHIAVQFIAYKRDKSFMLKDAVSVQIRIDPVKFYKLHTFQENDFFETNALIHTIIENDKVARPLVIDAKQLKQEMYASKNDNIPTRQQLSGTKQLSNNSYVRRYEQGKNGNPFTPKHRVGDEPVVIDLHANELLETTAGMSPGDILSYQLDVFRRTLADYGGNKGQKIIFIHGKGDGVLRRAIINELNYKYKSYPYQDASFQEYGYGATQVTIK